MDGVDGKDEDCQVTPNGLRPDRTKNAFVILDTAGFKPVNKSQTFKGSGLLVFGQCVVRLGEIGLFNFLTAGWPDLLPSRVSKSSGNLTFNLFSVSGVQVSNFSW